jgi:ubiquinone/menaquinone biosynthesis C-methylase UbiE
VGKKCSGVRVRWPNSSLSSIVFITGELTMTSKRPRLAFRVLAVLVCLAAAAFGAGLVLHALDERERPERTSRLAGMLGISPGDTVAEVGAGDGRMALDMARIVGPEGRVIATEVGETQVAAIEEAARKAGLGNVTVLRAGEHDSNLPAACCDAVYMQRVYHHLTDPSAVIASIGRALKPEGRLAVLDFEPGWIANFTTPAGVPDRGGHGVPKAMLVSEMKGYGFQPAGPIEKFDSQLYLAIFRR